MIWEVKVTCCWGVEMPFKPGESGNPRGRPKQALADGRSLADVAREYTVEAVETLAAIMRNQQSPAGARADAAGKLLDRGWGKPRQEIDATISDGTSLADAIAAGRARAAA